MRSLCKQIFSDKKNIIIIIYSIIVSILLSLQIKFDSINFENIKNMNIFLTLIFLYITLIISSFFMFDKNKVIQILFKKRYIFSIILFLLIILGKFNGCSIGAWNDYIQSSYDYSKDTIISSTKYIRSDEWLVNTPLMLSQKIINYDINNSLVRAVPTNIYLLSTSPVKDYIEIARPLSLGMFLGSDYGLSIWWYGRLFMLFFTSFELIRIITKDKRKVSLFGAILISGSSVVQWFFASYITEILIGGQLALICFYKIIQTENKLYKVLWSLLFTIGVLDYCLILYPAHQIPFGYIFLIIAIWIIYDNKDKKIIKNFKYFILPIIIILSVLTRFFILSKDAINIISSTVYPGNRFTNGGSFNEWQRLLQYPYTLLLPFKNTSEACTISSFMCLFPLPILVSLYYLIKNKNKNKSLFLLISGLLFIFLIFMLFCLIPLPNFFVKYTLLSKTTVNAICAPIGLICIYLMCLLFDEILLKDNNKILMLILSSITAFVCIYISHKYMPEYLPKYIIIFLFLLFIVVNYLYLTKNTKFKNNIVMVVISSFCIINIIYVNPVNIGTKMIYGKPLSKKIKEIVKEDESSRWIALDSFITPNYLMMNGAKTINSTNLYPNLKLWHKIDKQKKYENIYNRYAHIIINLTEDNTSFELIQPDLFKLNLNYYDLNKLNVKYIYSNKKIETNNINIKNIYDNDNSYIYLIKE